MVEVGLQLNPVAAFSFLLHSGFSRADAHFPGHWDPEERKGVHACRSVCGEGSEQAMI